MAPSICIIEIFSQVLTVLIIQTFFATFLALHVRVDLSQEGLFLPIRIRACLCPNVALDVLIRLWTCRCLTRAGGLWPGRTVTNIDGHFRLVLLADCQMTLPAF